MMIGEVGRPQWSITPFTRSNASRGNHPRCRSQAEQISAAQDGPLDDPSTPARVPHLQARGSTTYRPPKDVLAAVVVVNKSSCMRMAPKRLLAPPPRGIPTDERRRRLNFHPSPSPDRVRERPALPQGSVGRTLF